MSDDIMHQMGRFAGEAMMQAQDDRMEYMGYSFRQLGQDKMLYSDFLRMRGRSERAIQAALEEEELERRAARANGTFMAKMQAFVASFTEDEALRFRQWLDRSERFDVLEDEGD